MGRIKLLGIGLLIALLAVACEEAATPGPSEHAASSRWSPTPMAPLTSELTPEEFFGLVEQAITREGFVFHTFSETVLRHFWIAHSTQRLFTIEAWLDVGRGRGRSDFQKDPSNEGDLADSGTSIVFDHTEVWAEALTEELKKAREGRASR